MKALYSILTVIATVINTYSQINNTDEFKKLINVYIEDITSDMEFIKSELTFVNHVNNRFEADIYILKTTEKTGSGGNEHKLFFTGLNEFTGRTDTLSFLTSNNATEDEIRSNYLQMIKLGLISYIAHTSQADKIVINYQNNSEKQVLKDNWDNWIININGSGRMNGQKSNSYFYGNALLSVDRVTEDWKIELDASYNYYQNKYNTGNCLYTSESESKYGNILIVKSLNNHWSSGIYGGCNTSTYGNIDFSHNIFPTIEYNIYPYSESSRKQIRLKYSIGYINNNYTDTTIFNKTEEFLYSESIGIAIKAVQKWGSISIFVNAQNFLHDFSKNSVITDATLSIKLIKGLSLTLTGSYSFIHNQLSLPKQSASVEDIFLSQRQLATNYNYNCNIGLQYSFGSIYNNIVNPRFGN